MLKIKLYIYIYIPQLTQITRSNLISGMKLNFEYHIQVILNYDQKLNLPPVLPLGIE